MIKIPVLSTVKDIYKETFCNMKRFALLSVMWLVLIGVVAFFGYDLTIELAKAEFYKLLGYPMPNYETIQIQNYFYTFALNICGVFLIAGFVRSSMLKENGFKFDMSSIMFLVKYIILSILSVAIMVVFVYFAGLIDWNAFTPEYQRYIASTILAVAIATVVYVMLRLMLTLPNTFVSPPAKIASCWKASSGNVLRLIVIILLVSIPSILVSSFIFLQYSNIETGFTFDGEIFIYTNKWFYITYILLINVFSPLYGTLLSKLYKGLDVSGIEAEKTDKK